MSCDYKFREYKENPLLYQHVEDILTLLLQSDCTARVICEMCGLTDSAFRTSTRQHLIKLGLIAKIPPKFANDQILYTIPYQKRREVERLLITDGKGKNRAIEKLQNKLEELGGA